MKLTAARRRKIIRRVNDARHYNQHPASRGRPRCESTMCTRTDRHPDHFEDFSGGGVQDDE